MRVLFQKRHYTALAEILRKAKSRPSDSVEEAIADLQLDLSDLFRADDVKFKSSTFEAACNPRTASCS